MVLHSRPLETLHPLGRYCCNSHTPSPLPAFRPISLTYRVY